MDDVIRLCAAAILLLICLSMLKDKSPPMGIALTLCGISVLSAAFIPAAARAVYCIQTLADSAGLSDDILSPVLRVTGICLAVRLCSELCRDAGERALAALVETGGSAAAIVCAVPLIEQALRLVRSV